MSSVVVGAKTLSFDKFHHDNPQAFFVMVGMFSVNSEPMVVKYSLNLSAINCLPRVGVPFITNSWFCCDDVFLPIISLIICPMFFRSLLCLSNSLCYFNKLR